MVGRIKGIKEGLMLTLVNLREKIKTLETERASLMTEIGNLRKVAESRANALENEVSMLREEVKSLKDLLGNVE
jgi:predicted  nucleic acid-binding Zn-ribbon protein